MKRFAILFAIMTAGLPHIWAERVSLSTPNNTLVLEVNKGQEPQFVY